MKTEPRNKKSCFFGVSRINTFCLIGAIASLASCGVRDEVRSRHLAEYPFVFEEATGAPLMLLTRFGTYEFSFDKVRSNPSALRLLIALKAEVLYPNANGKIKLQGWIDHEHRQFVLKHWYLPPGFSRVHFADGFKVESVESKSQYLTTDDFNLPLSANEFFAKAYAHPLSE